MLILTVSKWVGQAQNTQNYTKLHKIAQQNYTKLHKLRQIYDVLQSGYQHYILCLLGYENVTLSKYQIC